MRLLVHHVSVSVCGAASHKAAAPIYSGCEVLSGSSGQASQEVYAGAVFTPEANIVTIAARNSDSCSSQHPFRHAVLGSRVLACEQQLTCGSKGSEKKKETIPVAQWRSDFEVLERGSNTADHRTRGHGRQRFSGTQRGRYF